MSIARIDRVDISFSTKLQYLTLASVGRSQYTYIPRVREGRRPHNSDLLSLAYGDTLL